MTARRMLALASLALCLAIVPGVAASAALVARGIDARRLPAPRAIAVPVAPVPLTDSVLIRDVRVVDARSPEASVPTRVLIEGGVIRGVDPQLQAPEGAVVVDGAGCWLIPGLWDLHVHLSQCGVRGLELFVAQGVTGVRDMGGDWETVRGWRDDIEAGRRIGPTLRAAGPVLETGGFVGMVDRLAGMLSEADGAALRASVAGRIGVDSPEQAKAAVQRLVEMGVDHVKIRSAASVEVYRALAAATREAGMDLVGHAPEQVVPVLECAKAGQRSVEHTSFAIGPSMLRTEDLAELAEALRASGTVMVPTLIADESYRLTADPDLRAHIDAQDGSERRRYATPEMLAFWRAQMAMKRFEGPIDWAGMNTASVGLLRTLREMGVPMLPGTDLGVVKVYPGFGLHDELGLMAAKLGMGPHELLSAATLGAARLVRMDEQLGTVEVGKRANLVLLEADPLQDLANLTRIRAVCCGPRWLDRVALDACLVRAAGEEDPREGADESAGESGQDRDREAGRRAAPEGGELESSRFEVEHRVSRVTPPEGRAACEVSVAVDPTNPRRMVAAYMHTGGGEMTTNYASFSHDGGRQWAEVPAANPDRRTQGDDALCFGPDGELYWSWITFLGIRVDRPRRAENGIGLHRSSDGGASWQGPVMVVDHLNTVEPFEDKPWISVDRSRTEHRGNLYVSWTRFSRYGSEDPAETSQIFFGRSTDGGQSFEPPWRISDQPGGARDDDDTVEGAVPAVGPDGEVYVVWAGPRGLEFDRSLDGGRTFGADRVIGPIVGGWDTEVEGLGRCNGMPVTGVDLGQGADRGSLYVNWSDQRHGDLDVFVMASRDRGERWSDPVRVHADPVANGAAQFLTWMAVDDSDGSVNVVFYDRAGRTGTSTGLTLARSIDGGRSFRSTTLAQPDFEFGGRGFFGDYLGLDAAGGRVVAAYAWYDGPKTAISAAVFDFQPGSFRAPEAR